NNFLTTVYQPNSSSKIGIANIDVSTGDFNYSEISNNLLKDELTRIQPSEIVVCTTEMSNILKNTQLENNPTITMFDAFYFEKKEALKVLKEHFEMVSVEGFGGKGKVLGKVAAGAAISYLKSLQNDNLNHITSLKQYSLDNCMQIDESARRNLELFKSIRYNSKHGSLIQILDKCKTAMGSRLLVNWLQNPLLELDEIEKRLEVVQILRINFDMNDEIRDILDTIGDLSRIITKVATKRIMPRELIALANYLDKAPQIESIISDIPARMTRQLITNIEDYSSIVALINKAIIDNPANTITDGNIISDNYHNELDELRQISRDGKSWIARLESEEKKKNNISSLKIGYNKVFGYYIEVTKKHKDKIPDHYIRKQTLVNSERYISPELKEYEAKVLGAEERIKAIEYELFLEIREKLFGQVSLMQSFVHIVSNLDVLCNFAYISYKNNYNQPSFNEEGIIDIKDSRHPVIEKLLQNEEFIPNDVFLNKSDHQIELITGPNMAGKSTYLRQIGLNVVMAQIGCFVPAKSANISICDKLFTRVGASDNLAMGQSTFLVEMLETASILNSATPDSLILLDEIGRGTSTFDGLSLAWAIVEYLHNNSRVAAKTLFATHYHELTELENILSGVKNYNIAIKEWKEELIFLRKIKRGGADQSYGIQVAKMAGVPNKIIHRAKQILKNLEEQELSPQGMVCKVRKEKSLQITIFDTILEKSEEKASLIDEILDLDINRMSPMEAFQYLIDLQKKIDN
ncbi:MAG: DNA mismatch repair protein MutS, partial [Candidatus Cloacimonadota bacterium]|nr:DNA mismatch repair protein MutS [Candidatus Cloacimonadota bacterium]